MMQVGQYVFAGEYEGKNEPHTVCAFSPLSPLFCVSLFWKHMTLHHLIKSPVLI